MAKNANICDVCTEIFAGGDAPKGRISKTRTDEYPIPIYSNGEENAGLYGFTDVAKVTAPSVTVSARGTIGYTAIRTEPFVPIVRLITLVPDQSKIDIKYLYYAVQNYKFEGRGTSIPQLTVPLLKRYNFPLPSKVEQQKVVSALDKVNGLIALRKEQVAKLDELVKSRFIELIVGKGYPVIPVKNLLVQNSTVEKISDTKAEKFVTVGIKGRGARQRVIKDGKWPVPFSGYRVKQGQFIYSRIDARNGAFAILPEEVDNAVVSKDFPVFDIKMDKIQPSILLFSVLQDDFVRQIQNSSFGATNRQRIQEDVFGEYTITLPPMEVQNHFATFVEQTDKSKLAIQQSLEKLETLKKALMQQYFG